MNTSYSLSQRSIPFSDGWDVIVAGGGPSGCAAAAAAAREGAKTLLIEATGALGGMGTQGLVPWFCGYSDGEKVIARGLAESIRQGLLAGMPFQAREQGWWPAIDPELLKRLYDDLVTGAGATVLFQSRLCAVERAEGGRADALVAADKTGLRAFRARVYIDCTGDGDLAAWAGACFEKGYSAGALQPATHCFMLTNVEPYDCWYNPPKPGDPPRAAPSLHFFDPESPVHKAVESGRYPLIVDKHSCSTRIGPRAYGYNFGHVYDVDNTDPQSVSRALIHGRKQAAQYRDAFAALHPAFADAFLAATGALLGARETRRIRGDYVLSLDDYLARRDFPDEICRNAYNIDVHTRGDIDASLARKLDPEELRKKVEEDVRQLGKGESYGVPYRCLTPETLRNVLVAGRCISTDRQVNGSVRIMACCLTTGEAAGVAAALAAAASDPDVHGVDTRDLRARLRRHGAYLPVRAGEKES
jgi:glycine/D-amino acid oxidase-like deaminating enzyme